MFKKTFYINGKAVTSPNEYWLCQTDSCILKRPVDTGTIYEMENDYPFSWVRGQLDIFDPALIKSLDIRKI
jgi:hypothetical protein